MDFDQLSIENETFDPAKAYNRDVTCSICLDDFRKGDVVKSLPLCKHLYHELCLKNWYEMSQSDTCPVCRRRFSVRPEENNAANDDPIALLNGDEED
jgi:hypothetical protein